MTAPKRRGGMICKSFIDALDWDTILSCIAKWAANKESRYVCICNVHSMVTASQDTEFCKVINEADMATPDGMPLVWILRKLGFTGQPRISGPDLMWNYCAAASVRREKIFFYGSTEDTLVLLTAKLNRAFDGLTIAGTLSPPFRPLTDKEDSDVVERINASGAGVVFVSLGCPKQECFMAKHRGRIRAVMIGVGAAFDYHAGIIHRAPLWMQRIGLEWLYRLLTEPRRLWRRYLITNTLFVLEISRQLLFRQRQ